ncbi:hypothetical protein [Deinococcus yavapaiensis]|uniref:ASCH domain-containing protein n=1 Tax=Deinococcus yavapaiensis KR-236 TaxID=694435 RepID=A0A318S7D2_9DEIO|nr:hypothetical protein [Deinococcus yavapaiensis]PYE50941.1 hypothetical protein DES52_1167 [Deinococcus yavapaiensis KR-236]
MNAIRGITLRHPWAFCVARLGKDVENRSWRPEQQGGNVGMSLAIHGGALPKGDALEEAVDNARHVDRCILTDDYLNARPNDAKTWLEQRERLTVGDFMTLGIVAVARLTEVRTDSPSVWAVDGQVHWCLSDVVTLPEPVPHRGAQGLWVLTPEALGAVRHLYKQAKTSGVFPT